MRLFVRPMAPAAVHDGQSMLVDAAWVLLDDDGQVRSQGAGNAAPLRDLAGSTALGEPTNIVLLLPAEHCLAVRCTIPGRSAGQMRRALPFVVEEHLASDLDSVHIAPGPIRRQTPIDTVVIDRALLRGWVDGLSALGLTPGYALADASLFPAEQNTITVLFEDERILLRTPEQWLAVEPDALQAALAVGIAEAGTEADLTVRSINGSLNPIDQAALEQGRTGRIDWQHDETDVPALVHLARRFSPARPGVNLLCDEFAPPRRRSDASRRWRPVAMLASVWLFVGFVALTARGLWAEHRADALSGEAEALYREYFPQDRRVQNVYRQMAARLGEGSIDESGALVLIGELAGVTTGETGAKVRSLAYNGERAELNAELAIPGFDRLDRIKTDLATRGLAVEISSAEQQDEGVLARLRIRGTD